jgi:hypothetical protein
MAYGLSTRAPSEDGPVAQVVRARSPVRSWHRLSEGCRFELIEQALLAVNNRVDGYPLAL